MPEIAIDRILEEKDGVITFTLTQPAPWEDVGVMDLLRKRLNEYIYTIQEGLFLDKYPEYRGRKFRIRLFVYSSPSEQVRLQLGRANQAMLGLGIEFLVTHIEVTP